MIKVIEINVIELETIGEPYYILKKVYNIDESQIKEIKYNQETQRYIITYEEKEKERI